MHLYQIGLWASLWGTVLALFDVGIPRPLWYPFQGRRPWALWEKKKLSENKQELIYSFLFVVRMWLGVWVHSLTSLNDGQYLRIVREKNIFFPKMPLLSYFILTTEMKPEPGVSTNVPGVYWEGSSFIFNLLNHKHNVKIYKALHFLSYKFKNH